MAHEAMECNLQMQLDDNATGQPALAEAASSQGGPMFQSAEAASSQGGPVFQSVEAASSQGGPVFQSAEAASSQGGPVFQSAEAASSQGGPVFQSAEAASSQGGPVFQSVEAASSQGGPVFQSVEAASSQGGPVFQSVEAASSQGGPVFQSAEVASSQGGPVFQSVEAASSQGGPVFQSVEAASSQGGPVFQSVEAASSQGGPHLLPSAPQMSIDLTEEVELLRDENVENINPGASEEQRQGSGANHTVQVASFESVSSFINGLQRLHGMLEFLRPPSDHNVGPVRARRRRGAASRRARAGASQRTDGARSRAPLDAYFQVSRSQPHLPTASRDSGAGNPVPEDLQVSSSSDSDSDVEHEEVVVQAEEPGSVVLEEQPGGISSEQEVTRVDGRELLPMQQSSQKYSSLLPSASTDEEEEGDTCTICLEQWTNAGDHRISALRCGHLFGFRCISKWLKGQTRKCPQCNKKAKHSDIVVLYARTLRALDTSELERLKSVLLQEQTLRKQAELETAQCRLRLQVLTEECTKLHNRVQDLQKFMLQHQDQLLRDPRGSQERFLSDSPSGQGKHKYSFQKTFTVSQSGNCRIMAYCDALSCLVVSQPSPQATFLPGFGVKMFSTANMKSSQYIPVHSKQIRGLAFNTQSKGLLLSASLDNTIKLTSLETNTVVQTYNAGRAVWSCCWCLDENNYFYAGLVNGSVLVYDLRNTSCYVQELVPQKARCPLVSLSYMPRAASAVFPYGGLLAGTLENASFWELKMGSYRPHVLPMESGGCIDFQIENSTRHCLVTYRPDKNHSTLRSVLMEMTYKLDDAGEPICSCHPVQTFLGGCTCKLLTKSAVFQNPEKNGNILVCTGNEASHSALLWDAGSGSLLQDLPADQPVLDICPFEVNHSNCLATLTEKTIHIYKWE